MKKMKSNSSGKEFLKKICENPYTWIFLLVSGLYAILYGNFVIGDHAYVYVDIGADTFSINYPLYCLFSDLFHGEGYHNYVLNVGLGMDMLPFLFQYLNPLNLFIVLLPKNLIPWGIVLMLYAKLMINGIFGYKLFFKWIKNQWGALTAVLVWTFSSYMMLWGQHYGMCTSMVLFTVFLYLVHLYIDDEEKSRNWILVLWITLMLFSNYYYLYMSGIYGALYIIFYLAGKKDWKKILCKLSGLAGMGVLGICIGGVCLVPTFVSFMGSARADFSGFTDWKWLFSNVTDKALYSNLARTLSNNILGVAEDYTGSDNYYEIAMLFTTSLFFLTVPRLLAEKKYRIRTAVLLILSALTISRPFCGKVLNMNPSSYRWTFVMCVMEAAAVGLYIKLLLEEKDRKKDGICIGVGVLLAAVVCMLVFYGQSKELYEIDMKYFGIFVTFTLVYVLLILGYIFWKRMYRVFSVLLVSVVFVEMAVANYPTINDRKTPTRHQLSVDYYSDGTKEAYETIQQTDPSLYRTIKNYSSWSENDSIIQGYNGLAVYMTTNQKELLEFQTMYGGMMINANRIRYQWGNYFLESLLGVKYCIAHEDSILPEEYYSYMGTVGNKEIYQKKNSLPFGYLYSKCWDKEEVQQMQQIDRTLAGLYGFYFTEDTENGSVVYDKAVRTRMDGISLIDCMTGNNDCTVEKTEAGIKMSQMKADPFIILNGIDGYFEKGKMYTVRVQAEVSEPIDMALYYKSSSQETFNGEEVYTFSVDPANNVWEFTIPGDTSDLRIDVSDETPEVTICDVSLISSQEDQEALDNLQNSQVSETSFENDTYQAVVKNTRDGVQMLCVPLLYSDGWNAQIDGIDAKVYNINSGLCGVEIPAGEHQVVIHYEPPYQKMGIGISAGGLLVYVLWIMGGQIYRRRKKMQ